MLTRRCPLSCAHCSTNSLITSEEHGPQPFLQLIRSFTAEDQPSLLLLTGGEPLLHPQLVNELSVRARDAGIHTYVITGAFFARQRSIPRPIARALTSVDHIAVSMDVYHEAEVSRKAVFRLIHGLLEEGKEVSLQLTGGGDQDPYLLKLIDDVRVSFADAVPMLVTCVAPVGRAREWLSTSPRPALDGVVAPSPCAMAAWPVVTPDGRVVACCNQAAIDGPTPEHLYLGSAHTDSWAILRDRYLSRPMLRGIRVFGPRYLSVCFGDDEGQSGGYCDTCHGLSTAVEERLTPLTDRASFSLIQDVVVNTQRTDTAGGSPRFLEGFCSPAFRDLVTLGY
jgi:pyruvate-formate lyase-activating enzyme